VNASRDMSVFGPSAQLASSGIMSVYISTGRGDAVRDGKLGGCMELELLSDMLLISVWWGAIASAGFRFWWEVVSKQTLTKDRLTVGL
jgi:hypothetical protein